MIVYVRNSIKKGVKIVRNEVDGLVWLKLDKQYFVLDSDWYIGITYIAPENSPIHDLYETDIFTKLEEDTLHYSQYGRVLVTVDTNSRVGQKSDVIYNKTLDDGD